MDFNLLIGPRKKKIRMQFAQFMCVCVCDLQKHFTAYIFNLIIPIYTYIVEMCQCLYEIITFKLALFYLPLTSYDMIFNALLIKLRPDSFQNNKFH